MYRRDFRPTSPVLISYPFLNRIISEKSSNIGVQLQFDNEYDGNSFGTQFKKFNIFYGKTVIWFSTIHIFLSRWITSPSDPDEKLFIL